jgi:hypothetical protein
MAVSRIAAAALLSLLLAAPAADAADQTAPAPQPASRPATPRPAIHLARHHGASLRKAEQRAEVAAHRAISLGQAIHTLRAHGKRAEVVRARLCRRGDKLVYVLTLLARSGKVIRANVDAGSGEVVSGR